MIVSQTPLRISFAGGATDFARYYREHEGLVVSAAIDKYIYVIVSPRFDDLIYVSYSKKEIVTKVADLQHELVREALARTGIQAAVEITMLADVPSEGSGLGSSSSLVVGLLHALYGYKGELVTAEQLAREACEIEIEICGKPIGKQDQYIAAYGGICEFRFRKDDTVGVRRFQRRPELFHNLSSQIMLFYTGRTRKSATILEVQDKRTEVNVQQLHSLKELAGRAAQTLDRGGSGSWDGSCTTAGYSSASWPRASAIPKSKTCISARWRPARWVEKSAAPEVAASSCSIATPPTSKPYAKLWRITGNCPSAWNRTAARLSFNRGGWDTSWSSASGAGSQPASGLVGRFLS